MSVTYLCFIECPPKPACNLQNTPPSRPSNATAEKSALKASMALGNWFWLLSETEQRNVAACRENGGTFKRQMLSATTLRCVGVMNSVVFS